MHVVSIGVFVFSVIDCMFEVEFCLYTGNVDGGILNVEKCGETVKWYVYAMFLLDDG